ncbi:MAG TPA: CxxxxCH/CxxCH domain-containing protein, partial [Desulfuromonadales bacterium]|nr:CxxxxCH/CxxCH domain-containing protein [Desulfuromonadales bacterium]
MKRSIAMSLVVLVQALLLTVGAFAATTVDSPHYDTASGFVCTTCHTAHMNLGSTGYNNICISCHRPGDPAAGMRSITPADAANRFGTYTTDSKNFNKNYQTSHRFDGSDTVLAAGAQPPVQAQMTTNNLRGRAALGLACVRCHNQHSNANGKFLRVANDQDQLCMDCHRSRNTTDQTKGTHPVGVTYDGTKAGFKAIPANSANTTADLNNYLKNGKVVCSTCHGVHYTDSRSSTVDGSANFANLSSGDGNLLRVSPRGKTDADDNICSTCHAGKTNHNLSLKGGKPAAQCNDCHSAHVEYDKDAVGSETTPNVFLVRRYLQYTTAGRISKRIIYNSTTTKNFYNSNGGGVCQSCHNPPSNHLTGSAVEPGHKNCTTCHNHNETTGAFSVSANMCTSCHGYPPSTNTSGGPTGSADGYTRANEATTPHAYHASSPYAFACSECHNGNNHNTGTFSDVFIDKTGIRAGASATYTPGTFTCSTVYCHSAGQGAGGAALVAGDYASPTWSNTTLTCGSCHKNMKSDATASGSHVQHAQSASIACATCHNGYTDLTVNAATHVDGSVNLSFSGAAASATYGQGLISPLGNGYGSCSNVSCHNVYGTAGVATSTWGANGAGCEACHSGAGTITSNGPATGSHTTVSGHAVACSTCHAAGTSMTIAPSTGHADGNVTIVNVGYPTTVAKHAAGSGYSSCSTAACHDPYSTVGTVTTPAWGTSGNGCAACHTGTTGTITASGPATGSHSKHGSVCTTCHAAGTTITSVPSTGHADNNVTLVTTVGYPLTVAKHAAGSGYSSCSTAACHNVYGTAGVATPAWGTTTGCTACHSGGFTATGPATGSHSKHGSVCTVCHAAGTTSAAAPTTGHADNNVTLVTTVGY